MELEFQSFSLFFAVEKSVLESLQFIAYRTFVSELCYKARVITFVDASEACIHFCIGVSEDLRAEVTSKQHKYGEKLPG